MREIAVTCLLLGLAAAPAASAAAAAAPADATIPAAADLVLAPERFRTCAECHGVELQGNRAVDAPRLAGLPQWYVESQIQAFRRGWRGKNPGDLIGMEMRPQAAVLKEAEVAGAAHYAASVPHRALSAATVTGDSGRGADLYRPCAACHGVRGEGNQGMRSPPLAGQSDWYLATQLRRFRAGARGSAPDDTQGALMRAAAQALPDDQAVDDVVAYVNTLESQQGEAP